MERRNVKVDIDNTIGDLTLAQIRLYDKRHGVKINYDDIVTYDYSCLQNADMISELYAMFQEKELWDSIRPLPNAQEYLWKLCGRFDVYLCTATDPANFGWKCEWIEKYFPYIPQNNIIRIHNKQMLMTDYAVDDWQNNLYGDMANRILIDAPWNRGVRDDVHGFDRVADMKEAFERICFLDDKEPEIF